MGPSGEGQIYFQGYGKSCKQMKRCSSFHHERRSFSKQENHGGSHGCSTFVCLKPQESHGDFPLAVQIPQRHDLALRIAEGVASNGVSLVDDLRVALVLWRQWQPLTGQSGH